MGVVAFEEAALNMLTRGIGVQCDELEAAYQELTELVDAVDTGAFTGQLAEAFKASYESNKEHYAAVYQTVDSINGIIKRNTAAGATLTDEVQQKIQSHKI